MNEKEVKQTENKLHDQKGGLRHEKVFML
jgi:hypothetical protein